MKESKEAKALAELEKELTSVLEEEYKFYKEFIKEKTPSNEKLEEILKNKFKEEIRIRFKRFTNHFDVSLNITKESIAALEKIIKELEEDESKSVEKEALLTASRTLKDETEKFESGLDDLCNKFFDSASKKRELTNSESRSITKNEIIGGLIGGMVGLLVGACFVAAGLFAFAFMPPLAAFCIMNLGGVALLGGILLGPFLASEAGLNKIIKKDLSLLAEGLKGSAEKLTMLAEIRQENVTLVRLSPAEPGNNESAQERLAKSSKPNPKNVNK